MKKIFHISGTTIPGGGPEHIFQLLKRLNRNEWKIIICTSKDGPYWEKFNSLGIKTYNLALRILSLKTSFKLFLILRKEKPDLIHTHGKGPGLYGRIISRFLKKYPDVTSIQQKGRSTFYRRRTKKDSILNINLPIKKLFNQMRIANNDKWPSFFYFKNKKYIIKIFKSA